MWDGNLSQLMDDLTSSKGEVGSSRESRSLNNPISNPPASAFPAGQPEPNDQAAFAFLPSRPDPNDQDALAPNQARSMDNQTTFDSLMNEPALTRHQAAVDSFTGEPGLPLPAGPLRPTPVAFTSSSSQPSFPSQPPLFVEQVNFSSGPPGEYRTGTIRSEILQPVTNDSAKNWTTTVLSLSNDMPVLDDVECNEFCWLARENEEAQARRLNAISYINATLEANEQYTARKLLGDLDSRAVGDLHQNIWGSEGATMDLDTIISHIRNTWQTSSMYQLERLLRLPRSTCITVDCPEGAGVFGLHIKLQSDTVYAMKDEFHLSLQSSTTFNDLQ